MLDRAAMYKAKTVNFMITHYWVDKDFNGEVSSALLSFGLCWTLEGTSCQPVLSTSKQSLVAAYNGVRPDACGMQHSVCIEQLASPSVLICYCR